MIKLGGDYLIAEIHRKLSANGIELLDRSEDKLTGDFFGRLRYLPFHKGLKILLDDAKTLATDKSYRLNRALSETKDDFIGDKIEFWPSDERAELDVLIALDRLLIGVEVKFNSGLSSEDQLERELRVIESKLCGYEQGVLLFISKASGLSEAIKSINKAKEKDEKIFNKIIFAYISWEDIYEAYKILDLTVFNDFEKQVLKDIQDLLRLKGFEKFKDFKNVDDSKIMGNRYFGFDGIRRVDFNFNYSRIVREEDYYEFGLAGTRRVDFNFSFSRNVTKEEYYEFG